MLLKTRFNLIHFLKNWHLLQKIFKIFQDGINKISTYPDELGGNVIDDFLDYDFQLVQTPHANLFYWLWLLLWNHRSDLIISMLFSVKGIY